MNDFLYNKNPLLKKTGTTLSYTKEQVEELVKCKEDPIYFIENYCKIVSLDHEEPILFSLYKYQKKFIEIMHKERRIISMQPRQMGKTQTVAAYICWYITFQSNQTVAILANKGDASREILSRCKFMYEYLPSWMQHGIKKWNEGSIQLENGSKAFTGATSKAGLRGKSCVSGDTKICVMDDKENISYEKISSLVGCSNLKVLTERDFKKFETVIYQGIKELLRLSFDDGSYIKATYDHQFWCEGEWVYCEDAVIGDNLYGKIVTDIQQVEAEEVYDVFNVEDTHSYISNGVLSHNCNFLYIDEASIIQNNIADDFFTAIYPIISAGKNTKIVITSTPLGYNHFWKYWNEAEKGKNGFVPLRVYYEEHPSRDEKWAQEQRQLLGDLKFNQEILCSFLGSQNSLISGDALSKLSAIDFVSQQNEVDFIEYPIEGHTYFISVDTAEGVGGDYSAFSVIDITEFPYKTVAKFHSNLISYLLYPNVINQIGKMYNNAFVLVETNSIGNQVAHILYEDLEYENLMMVSQESKRGQYLSLESKANYGVKTTKQVKRIGCQTLKTLIEDQKFLVIDVDGIQELTTFVESRGTFSADEGYHDDIVMTYVLFAWATQDNMFKDIINTDTRKAIIERREKEMEEFILPVGYFSDGTEEEEIFSFF